MPSLAIQTNIGLAKSRRYARSKSDGRPSHRMLVVANALDGMNQGELAGRTAHTDGQILRDWVIRINRGGGGFVRLME